MANKKPLLAMAERIRELAKDMLLASRDELAVYYNENFGADIGGAAFSRQTSGPLSLRAPRNTTNKLRIVTGDLARAVSGKQGEKGVIFKATIEGDKIVLESGVDPDIIKYARIHELGGTIKHPGGTPYVFGDKGQAIFISKDRAKQLRADGRNIKETKAHSITMPARPYLKPGMEAYQKEALPRYVKRLIKMLSETK